MSDTAEENVEPTEPTEPIEPTEPVEPAPKANKSGHKTREQWEEAGNDPADYVSEEIFEVRGSFIKQISKLKRELAVQKADHDASLTNQNKLHAIALDNRIKTLEAERDEAIDLADKATANRKQQEIDDNRAVSDSLKEETVQVSAPVRDPELAEWESKNAWIFDVDDPRAAYAKVQFSKIKQSGEVNSYPELFAKLEAKVANKFPETPASKRAHRTAEKGSGHSQPKAAALKSSDITADEGKYFAELGWQVVPGKDDVKLPNGKTIKNVDKALMMTMIADARAE